MAGSAVLRTRNDSGDRDAPNPLCRLWGEGGEGGSTAEQSAVQQTLRGGTRQGLRKRGRAPSGPSERDGREYSAVNRSALSGALGSTATQEAIAADGSGR